MKKIIAFLMCVILMFSFCSCRQKKAEDTEKLQIVTAIFPLFDFVRQIGGDKVSVTMLLPTGADVHSYEPSVQDIIKIKESDLFVRLGMEADPWTDSVIKDAGNKNITVFSAMEYADLKAESHKGHEHEEHEDRALYDQHVWTSVKNSQKIIEALKEALIHIDKENAPYYENNEKIYLEKLSKLDEKFEKLAEKNKGKTIFFADRFPFRYFAEDYGFGYFSAFGGCSSESEPSASRVSELIGLIKKEKKPVVFYTETSNRRLADTVCEETGAEKLLLHSCHTVTKKELDGGITYTDLMERNYETLKRAFEKNY